MNFDYCIKIVLKNEGGYVHDPDDPGGETKYGITKRQYPDLDIKALTVKEAADIYHKDYWFKMNMYLIIDKDSALQIFDMGVNAGPYRAIRISQQICRVDEDGIMGPVTAGAINNYDGFVMDYKHARRVHYEFIAARRPSLRKFLKGWINRVNHT